MNKKGANNLISVYWFFILVIVAGGIVMMVNSFYSSPYDVRNTENEILSKKVANCIMEGGKLSSELDSATGVFRPAFEENFMEICGLNFDVETEFERPQYYVQVEMYKSSNLRNKLLSIEKGNQNWKEDCNFENKNEERTAKCLEKEFYVTDSKKELYLVKTLTIIGKTKENVK